jgi:hypothetical protein
MTKYRFVSLQIGESWEDLPKNRSWVVGKPMENSAVIVSFGKR